MNMDIGLIIGIYVFTRLLDSFRLKSLTDPFGSLFALIAMIVTALSVMDMLRTNPLPHWLAIIL